MTTITDKQWDVLINIIGAVETGGQVYGQRRYDDYTEAYTNSSAENSITIGAFQEFSSLAKGLLQEILDRYPDLFRSLDNAGIESDLKKPSWSGYSPSRGSAKANAITTIISTAEGRKIQNERILRQMKQYVEYGESLGVTEVSALFEACNFCHQGGTSAAKRIISKTNRPYTLDNLYQATLSDTGNQVGAYRSRQRFVYNALKEHMEDDTMQTADEVRAIRKKAADWMINLAEDNSRGYDQTWRWGERGDYDCSSAVISAYQAAGVPVKDMGATYTGNMRKVFLQAGFVDITGSVNRSNADGMLLGDVLLNEVHHTAMYLGDGREVEASINEKGGARGGQPGDQTGKEILIRSYRNYPWDCVLRYVGTAPTDFRPVLRAGDRGESVKELQRLLNDNGARLSVDGEFGKLTTAAVIDFQGRHMLICDGIVGEKTWHELDHQVQHVLRTPGVVRVSPRKSSKCLEKLKAGDPVRVFELAYNESAQKLVRMEKGWIIADNVG